MSAMPDGGVHVKATGELPSIDIGIKNAPDGTTTVEYSLLQGCTAMHPYKSAISSPFSAFPIEPVPALVLLEAAYTYQRPKAN